MNPSHTLTDAGDKIVIHGLEVFCAYDPRIDGDHDEELQKFDNDRVKQIVHSTNDHMKRGSNTQLVVMHERDGDEPKSCVGRFTKISYEERDGVGFIVGDCEVERPMFDRLLATNAFPRRSAEIWQEQNHLSEVALLGRETPRRPLPDTRFTRNGERIMFSKPTTFDSGTVGGGLSTSIPDTKGAYTMADDNDLRAEIDALKLAVEELKAANGKTENSADDMLSQQFAEEEGDGDGVHIDIDSHGDEDDDEDDDEDEKVVFPASRAGKADTFALRRDNIRMSRELATIRAELNAEKFSRELDGMEQDGYRIPAERRPQLISELAISSDPSALIDTWRDLFARDPYGTRIDMSRAALPQSSNINTGQVSDLVREFAGRPAEFTKAINSRLNGR